MDALETTLNTVNNNLTNMSMLFEQFMAHYASIVSGMATSRGATPVVTPLVVPSPLVGPSAPSATLEAAMLKNMKPPVFKGEKHDCNKDAIHTFLHKWADMHRLRRTPTAIMATETRLSLEGKAYKWWMSLPVETHPKILEEFEAVFRKEFLPEMRKSKIG